MPSWASFETPGSSAQTIVTVNAISRPDLIATGRLRGVWEFLEGCIEVSTLPEEEGRIRFSVRDGVIRLGRIAVISPIGTRSFLQTALRPDCRRT